MNKPQLTEGKKHSFQRRTLTGNRELMSKLAEPSHVFAQQRTIHSMPLQHLHAAFASMILKLDEHTT